MAVERKEEWCFGMIVGYQPRIANDYSIEKTPIELQMIPESDGLLDAKNGVHFGRIPPKLRQMLDVLNNEISIQILADGIEPSLEGPSINSSSRQRKSNKISIGASLQLKVNLYGNPALFEAVGAFAARCQTYLQHPIHCDRNVPYRNPQCLSPLDDTPVMTWNLDSWLEEGAQIHADVLTNPIDLFTDPFHQEDLGESRTPQALATPLYRHQKQALTFMMERERGWALEGKNKDIWKKEIDAHGRILYVNSIAGQRQTTAPIQFRGGLLIDAPGLGKSLSVIALIAAGMEQSEEHAFRAGPESKTLLIVPKSLIQTWKDELEKHLKSSTYMQCGIYYGRDRTRLLKDLQNYSLLITTYSVARKDWQASKVGREPSTPNLYDFTWGRIVLDEAHIIREPSRSFAKSVCALDARKRWAVTGTPIQNRLLDLYSLFKFLRCTPFSDLNVFNKHVTQQWKLQFDPQCVAKLKTLVNCLSLRRPKTTIELPPRTDVTIELKLNPWERQQYNEVAASTRSSIEAVEHEANGSAIFNVLKWMNQLRLLCNHGPANHLSTRKAQGTTMKDSRNWDGQLAQSYFDHLDGNGLARCSSPTCQVDLGSALSSENDNDHEEDPYIDDSITLLCFSCKADKSGSLAGFLKVCNHFPRALVNRHGEETDPVSSDWPCEASQLLSHSIQPISTKIARVIQDLEETPEISKCVVFSSWTTTFNNLQPQLQSRGIRCVRLDGSLSATGRANVLRAFRNIADIKVLLATISCGGVGLDLTAASRAYIMEPQWNPMSETQALDRVHRLGQQREVTTIRYFVKDSWEENVLTLQKRKQELADLTLSSGAINKAEITRGRLRYLKELVG